MLLENKNAIIYGAGGNHRQRRRPTFAREGATVFLVGRTGEKLDAVAKEITAAGGSRRGGGGRRPRRAGRRRACPGCDRAGSIDVSLNLISRGDVQGTPLLDMRVDDFLYPITTGVRSNYITARSAARHMVQQGSGVILMVTSGSGEAWTPPDVWAMGGPDRPTRPRSRSCATWPPRWAARSPSRLPVDRGSRTGERSP